MVLLTVKAYVNKMYVCNLMYMYKVIIENVNIIDYFLSIKYTY